MRGTLEFKETLQIGIVVPDLERAMRVHYERYGIGPWEITNMAAPDLTELTRDDEPADYGMRVALAMVGGVQWELIEPTSGDSLYSDFLKERPGGGLHHVLVGVESYGDTLDQIRALGKPVSMAGNWKGIANYAYLPTEDDLGYILEVFEATKGDSLEDLHVPDEIYPPAVA